MDQIRIGIIGAGNRVNMAPGWHQPEGRSVVAAVADINQARLDWVRSEINSNAFVSQDYRDILDRQDIDAVAILSPDFTHEEIAVAAFQAGKHVFCEKPLAITTEGCDAILQAWLDSGKEFMVGFNMRYMNLFRVMKDVVDSGVIGEIKAVWVRHFVGLGGDFFYHDWHSLRENCNGLLLQKASHDIDMIHWITGHYGSKVSAFGGLDYYGGNKSDELECPTCPERSNCVEFQSDEWRVKGWMNKCAFRNEIDVEDNDVVIMQLDNGIKATYSQCHFSPDYFRNYTFIGTEGRVENLDNDSKVIVKLRDRSSRWKNLADQVYNVKEADGGHGGADPIICKDFVDMVIDGKQPIATPLAGRMSVAVGCAATESIRDGGNVKTVPSLPKSLALGMEEYDNRRSAAESDLLLIGKLGSDTAPVSFEGVAS